MMRVGVDARLMAEPITGIGRYTWEMVRALQQQPELELRLYLPRPVMGDNPSASCTTLRTARMPGRPGKMLWSQTLLPLWAARDQVQVFWGPTHRLPARLPARIARVVTIHDLVWRHAGATMRPLSRLLERALMPHAVAQADVVMADSAHTAADIEAEFPQTRDKVRVVHPAASRLPPALGLEALRPLGITRPYVLFVGTLEPRKNLPRLLQAFAALPADLRASHQLVVAGGQGWGGVDLPRAVAALGLQDTAVLPGYVSDQVLATLYAHARCLAMPSLHEGFGLPLVEAMACGVPVITSNLSSMPEVAQDAGLLVNPLQVQEITAALHALLGDFALHARLAARAGHHAQRFNWQHAAQQARLIFEEALYRRRIRLRSTPAGAHGASP
ncbi:MAG: glycosyltransferase family 1 protein [Pseudomonadota bacterium]|nr:glycosyltransferase family 1 protein [Pseudomonadota bacterium]